MRSSSLLTAAALTASGIVLSAGAAGAQTATPNPDIKNFPTGPVCADGAVTGTVKVVIAASKLTGPARLTVDLRWNAGGTAFEESKIVDTRVLEAKAGNVDYPFTLSPAAVPSTAKNLRVVVTAKDNGVTTDTVTSVGMAVSSCAAPTWSTAASGVSISCSGDVVSGSVSLVDPPTSGTVPVVVAVQGRDTNGTWAPVKPATTTPVGAGTTSVPYSVSLDGVSKTEYRTLTRVNSGAAVFSDIIPSTSCAPAEVVPEAPAAVLIPLTLAVTAGTVVAVRRRRAAPSLTASA